MKTISQYPLCIGKMLELAEARARKREQKARRALLVFMLRWALLVAAAVALFFLLGGLGK